MTDYIMFWISKYIADLLLVLGLIVVGVFVVVIWALCAAAGKEDERRGYK